MKWLFQHRFLMLRRLTQLSLIVLYFGANAWGWHLLEGTLSGSFLFETIPLADPLMVLQISATGALVGADVLLGALLIAGFYALIGGRAFCSWVCPVNLVTDTASWLRRVLRINEVIRSDLLNRNIRYWVLGLTILLSAIFGVAAFELISPIGILNRGLIFGMGFGGFLILAIFLFDLLGERNGYCGHICPLGAFYALNGRFGLIRVDYDRDKCSLCMKCLDVCPERPVLNMIGKHSDQVTMSECTKCARCIEVCDDDALKFQIRTLK